MFCSPHPYGFVMSLLRLFSEGPNRSPITCIEQNSEPLTLLAGKLMGKSWVKLFSSLVSTSKALVNVCGIPSAFTFSRLVSPSPAWLDTALTVSGNSPTFTGEIRNSTVCALWASINGIVDSRSSSMFSNEFPADSWFNFEFYKNFSNFGLLNFLP